jgi:predicted flap endonuclease-1-like 5' DNA nuclease
MESKETAHMPTPESGTAQEHPQKDDPQSDLPSGLSKPALQALHAAGYTRLDQLATVTEADVLALHGMGPKGIKVIREALDARGKSFADAKSA